MRSAWVSASVIASSKRVRRVLFTSSTLGSDISVSGCLVAFSMWRSR